MAAKRGAQIGQTYAQPLNQVVESLQAERHCQRFDSRFGGTTLEKSRKQLPQPGGANAVARQRLGQENRKGATAAPALATIGAKNPLPAQRLSIGYRGIIAVKLAVPV